MTAPMPLAELEFTQGQDRMRSYRCNGCPLFLEATSTLQDGSSIDVDRQNERLLSAVQRCQSLRDLGRTSHAGCGKTWKGKAALSISMARL